MPEFSHCGAEICLRSGREGVGGTEFKLSLDGAEPISRTLPSPELALAVAMDSIERHLHRATLQNLIDDLQEAGQIDAEQADRMARVADSLAHTDWAALLHDAADRLSQSRG